MTRIASGSQTIGPFFHVSPTFAQGIRAVVPPEAPGDRIRIRVRVLDGAGQPLDDALVELLQPGGFGRLPTNDAGECEFETVRPSAPAGEAAHIDLCVFARGLPRHLYTRIYFEDDAGLGQDPMLSVVPADRRQTLLARKSGGGWDFTIRLQGSGETVFFDV